jgi:hypothetical protein
MAATLVGVGKPLSEWRLVAVVVVAASAAATAVPKRATSMVEKDDLEAAAGLATGLATGLGVLVGWWSRAMTATTTVKTTKREASTATAVKERLRGARAGRTECP